MFITEVYPSSAYETPPCHIVFLESQKLSLDYVVWTHQYFIVNVTGEGRVFNPLLWRYRFGSGSCFASKLSG